MPSLVLLVVLSRLASGGLFTQVPESLLRMSAFGSDGKPRLLADLASREGLTVFLFMGADCPLSQKAVTEVVRDLEGSSPGKTVGVVGLLVARDDEADIERLKKEFGVTFPMYLDKGNALASRLEVEVVPTAVLVDSQGRVLYQGRINDRVEELGKRATVRRRDLREAVADAMAGNPVRVPRTKSAGCPVEIRKPTPGASGTVSYYRDIQPILYKKCVGCHQAGGVAPFTLADYDDATLWLETALPLIERKQMPPGQGESDFELADAPEVPTVGEIALMKKWLDEGMPKGAPPAVKLPLPSTDPDADSLGKPDFLLKMEGPMTIAPVGDDLYRFVVFKLNLDRDLKVRAVRLVPGNRKVVHHALIYHGGASLLESALENKELRDTQLLPGDKGPGFGMSQMLVRYFAPKKGSTRPSIEFIEGYVPGVGRHKVPDNYAINIPKHSDLVVQIHYHRTGREEVDDSAIALYLAQKDEHPDKVYQTTNLNDENFLVMPPNQRRRTRFDWPVEEDCEVVGLSPHGHNLTISQTLTLFMPDGSSKILLHVPAFDFNWQRGFTYKTPIPVPKGSTIRVSSLMDNTAGNPRNPSKPPKPVYLGENTTDEMVFPFLSLIVHRNTKWNLDRGRQAIFAAYSQIQALKKGFGLDNAGPDSIPDAGGKKP